MSRKTNFTSFAEHNPELVSEWHPTLNFPLTPNDVSYGSAKKAWWICKKGHIWEDTLNHRSRGRGCSICGEENRRKNHLKSLMNKQGSLAETNPSLAEEWHPTKNNDLSPYDVLAGSGNKAWWQCKKDQRHEWSASIKSRNNGSGCPFCSGHKVVKGVNDLATLMPDLAAQWHPTKNAALKPSQISVHNGKTVWWICDKNHEWRAKISNRSYGGNCPYCGGKKVFVGYNDLASIMPSLAKEWHPYKNGKLTPQNFTVSSNKKVWWICEKNHSWQATIAHRSRGRRCPQCFGETKTSFPEQAIFFYLRQVTTAYNRYKLDAKTEIDIYLPEYKIGVEYDGAYFHDGEKARIRENKKQEKLNNMGILLIRVREIEGATSEHTIYTPPRASEIELTQMLNSLFSTINKIAKTTLCIDIDIARDRNKIYEQYIQNEKENSLAAKNPQLAKEWHPSANGCLLPEYVSANSNKSVWWKCENGHEWVATVGTRNKGVGCKECSKMKKQK